ncbi:hypothetical protein CLAFUW4_14604 [Fulvia fulva]|uniref:Uncharacterized protein n=1 Tax=Passalora fulva TaxID=5499 RepID=A0A9Q8PN07_PASFU|nr:uncharacterized protein CLAFUR5_14433 [Fulvia fulva]KAK4609437.1 hypothetical protein CLAFUR4_14598 [Fulvia fulva]KAK4609816.1 hypothetical protein CLAFUR0_14598 [Fulvia fulva]UJO25384.1 hypothetical protein CLAFUR5_14433 [Fulvia fulva]WPV22613.1 hypothetical protein CLAFUW4_14604 [Fulvia fulva]WPV37713.1 hypothetical protein CLAFUW7_14607 [Fulvia fulva]
MPTQSILLSLLSLTTLTTLATASSMKVQYYTDGGCTSYAVETYPFANWDCYNYSWGGSNSANIAACNPDYQGGICSCTFFTSSNCGGQGHTAEWSKVAREVASMEYVDQSVVSDTVNVSRFHGLLT